jgi:hypothetical protein
MKAAATRRKNRTCRLRKRLDRLEHNLPLPAIEPKASWWRIWSASFPAVTATGNGKLTR